MQCEKEHSHIFLGKLVLAVIGEQLLHSEKLVLIFFSFSTFPFLFLFFPFSLFPFIH